jgi:hypothetical protein
MLKASSTQRDAGRCLLSAAGRNSATKGGTDSVPFSDGSSTNSAVGKLEPRVNLDRKPYLISVHSALIGSEDEHLPMRSALEIRLLKYQDSSHYRRNDLGLLFAIRRGFLYSADRLREQRLGTLRRSLKMPLGGFRGFCHAIAAELVNDGAPISVAQSQPRHSNTLIALGQYGHAVPQSQRDALRY